MNTRKLYCNKGILLAFLLSLLISIFYAAPLPPGTPTWKPVEGKITDTVQFTLNASTENPVTSYQLSLYKYGTIDPINTYDLVTLEPEITSNTAYEVDCSAAMISDYTSSSSKYESYYIIVTATNNNGSYASPPSGFNSKGLSGLSILGTLSFGSEPEKIIYNKISASDFNFQQFVYSSATIDYNFMVRNEVGSIILTLPAANENDFNTYSVNGLFNGSDQFFFNTNANGALPMSLTRAAGSSGRDVNGIPTDANNNNVITITVNASTSYERIYTLRLRRRVLCPVASLGSISPSAASTLNFSTIFSCPVTGGNGSLSPSPSDVNGDTIATRQDLLWQVIALTGTGYFIDNTFHPLSNGTVKIKASTLDGTKIQQITTEVYTISGQSNWFPHLGKLELKSAKSPFQVLDMSPLFSAENPSGTIYQEGIVDEFSSVSLSTMAPPDCQLFLNGVRIANNTEVVLRMEPKTITTPFNDYILKVVNNLGERSYTIRIERDVKERLRFGRETGNVPYLSAPDGEYFGMNTSGVTQAFTIQAWARWTSEPANRAPLNWANIVTMDHSTSDQGQFWLQHNSGNTAFEFAFRSITSTNPLTFSRQHISSVTVPQRGVWYHLTGVWNGSVIILYVNGIEEARRNLAGSFNTNPPSPKLWIGRSPSTSARYFPGNVRDVRMYVGSFRTAAQVWQDYIGTSNNDSNYSWPLEETSIPTNGVVTRGNGDVDIRMNNVQATDFVACCLNNMAQGQTMIFRPSRIDVSSASSQSVILVHAKGYNSTNPKISILGIRNANNDLVVQPFGVWNSSNAWVEPASIEEGVSFLGDTATSTRFWLPIIRNSNTTGEGRYVDDGGDYDGSDGGAAGRILYNTILPLPPVSPMTGTLFTISGRLVATTTHPLSKKYVILGYDETEKGTLITATSSDRSSSKDKAAGDFALVSDVPIKRIEVRTQDDILIRTYVKSDGYSVNTPLGDVTLPVELSSFTSGFSAHGFVQLMWVTQSETNVRGFYVYRSGMPEMENSLLVSPLIPGSNTSSTQSYIFTDRELNTPGEYYYWLQSVDLDGSESFYGPLLVTYHPEGNNNPEIPLKTTINSIYPNPFNPTINVAYSLKEAAEVSFVIYNHRGQQIKSFAPMHKQSGWHSLRWDGVDNNGNACGNGIYLLRFKAGNTIQTRKVSLIK